MDKLDHGIAYPNGPIILVSRQIAYTFPLSYAYLAGYLQSKNEDVKVLFRGGDQAALVRQVMAAKPLLVGFGSLYPELKQIRGIIDMLNAAGRRFPVVVGGQMVSPTPAFSLAVTGADYGIIGEGEITLYRLVKALRRGQLPEGLPGLVSKRDGLFSSLSPGDYIKDLDQLPPLPYQLFPESQWLPIGRWYAANVPQPHWRFDDRVISVHGGRGCPYRCNFCYHHSRPRYRSVPLIVSEGVSALKRFNAHMLNFSDDLVLSSPRRARQLVAAINEQDYPFEYALSARFDILSLMDDDLLADMKASGCRIMGLGIESGADRVLKLIGKRCTAAMVLDGLRRLKDHGILATVSIMVGQHTETRADVEASIALMRQSVRYDPCIQYAFTITTPFPGSQLYDVIFEKGLLKNHIDFYKIYFSGKDEWNQVVNLSAMSDAEVRQMYRKIKRAYRWEKLKALGIYATAMRIVQILIGKLSQRMRGVLHKAFSDRLLTVFDQFSLTLINALDRLRLRLEIIASRNGGGVKVRNDGKLRKGAL